MDAIRELLTPRYLWLLAGFGLLFMELLTPGLIIFFFGMGALLVGILCFFVSIPLPLQLLLFVVSSVCFLLALRKWAKRVFMGRETERSGRDLNSPFAGSEAVVIAGAQPGRPGRVELNGTEWRAVAETELKEGQIVRVTGQESLTLKVDVIHPNPTPEVH